MCCFEAPRRHGYQRDGRASGAETKMLCSCLGVRLEALRMPGGRSFLPWEVLCPWEPDCSSAMGTGSTSGVDTCLFHIEGFFEFLQVDFPVFPRNGLKLVCHPLKPFGVLLGTHGAGRRGDRFVGLGWSRASGGSKTCACFYLGPWAFHGLDPLCPWERSLPKTASLRL